MIGSQFPCLPAKQWGMLWTTWQASLKQDFVWFSKQASY